MKNKIVNKYYIRSDIKENRPTEIDIKSLNSLKLSELTNIYLQYDVYKFCKRLIKKKKLKSILDVGCDSGFKLMILIYPVAKDVYGINDGAIIDYCKKQYGIDTFLRDNIENSSLKIKKKFDLIICADVIEHLRNPDTIIDYIKKYCHNNTYIVLSTPNRDIARGKDSISIPNRTHIREWNQKEFYRYLKSRNLNILLHLNIKAYRILFFFKEPMINLRKRFKTHLSLIKRYGLKRYKYNQIVVANLKIEKNHKCKLKTADFKLTLFRDKIHYLLILFHILFYCVVFKDWSPVLKKLKFIH